ncbi:MAG: WD40 repeat domain-containing protein [Candidatus Thorarchaeota archaeon]|nr:WD40 repeat domain-containing protein [Candidatus Thorarchaeota archaeon]
METQEASIFLKPIILKAQAEHGSEITRRFAMNKAGRMFAAALQDRSIRLYAADTGEEMQRIQDDFLCTSIAFSPKGDVLASGSVERVVKLWDIRSGDCLATLEGHEYPILALAFSPDGNKLVSGSGDTTLMTWDLENQSRLHHLKGHGFYVVTCDWDPQDNRIVSGSVDAKICEWNSNSGELIQRHDEHRAAVHRVRFTPDGSRLASGSSDLHIILWDSSGTPMKVEHILQGHSAEVRALAFSEDGKYLASGSSDKIVYLWDTEKLAIHGEAATMGEIDGIEWNPKTSSFLTADGTGAIIRWEVTDLAATMAPFEAIFNEIKSTLSQETRDELVQKFESLCSNYDEETLATKKIFYLVWQCKRELGLLKGTTRKK